MTGPAGSCAVDVGDPGSLSKLVAPKTESGMAVGGSVNAVPSRLNEDHGVSFLVELDFPVHFVSPVLDSLVSAIQVNVVVGQRFHHLKPAKPGALLEDRQNESFIVVFMAGPAHTVSGIIPGMKEIVGRYP